MNDFIIEKGILKEYKGKDTKVTIPDGVKKIGWGVFEYCGKLVIHVSENSYAHKYAKENKIKFEIIK